MYQELNENASKSRTRLYNIWKMMRKRCNNSNRSDYKYYGGRGIKVCEEWNRSDGYEKFKKWSLKNGYNDKLTIDRIDTNGNYCPENCRWVNMKTQMRNTRKNLELGFVEKENGKYFITYKNEKHSVYEWGKIVNIDYHTLINRIKRGWTAKQILFTKIS